MSVLNKEKVVDMSLFKDVMVDLETLGQGPGCIILSIGAVAFYPRTMSLGPTFYQVFNIANQKGYGLRASDAALAWWDKQSDDARQVINQATDGGDPLRDGLLKFTGWLQQFPLDELHVWGNGADFDNAILQHLYRAADVDVPWKFWNNRCFRTLSGEFRDLYPKPSRRGIYHNALDDATWQANWANKILSGVFHDR